MSTKRKQYLMRWRITAVLLLACTILLFILVDIQGPRLRRVEYIPAPTNGGLAQWRFYFNQPVKSPEADQIILSSGTFYSATTTNDVVTIQTIENSSLSGEKQQVTLRDLKSKHTDRHTTVSHTVYHPDVFLYNK